MNIPNLAFLIPALPHRFHSLSSPFTKPTNGFNGFASSYSLFHLPSSRPQPSPESPPFFICAGLKPNLPPSHQTPNHDQNTSPSPSSPSSSPPLQALVHRHTSSWACITSCGACCFLDPHSRPELADYLSESELTQVFDMVNEDGWCKHYDPASHRCRIFDNRPDFCRAEPETFHRMFGVALDEFEAAARVSCVEQISDIYGEDSNVLDRFKQTILELDATAEFEWYQDDDDNHDDQDDHDNGLVRELKLDNHWSNQDDRDNDSDDDDDSYDNQQQLLTFSHNDPDVKLMDDGSYRKLIFDGSKALSSTWSDDDDDEDIDLMVDKY